MSNLDREIAALEEQLRLAELGPDPDFFQAVLADDVVLVNQAGDAAFAKAQVVAAHRPGVKPPFTRVEMSDVQIIGHGDSAAVVTCRGLFSGPGGSATLRFMRVWLKTDGRWQIVAGSVSNA
jgi:uncharacterized protein (TIGR02246 family)